MALLLEIFICAIGHAQAMACEVVLVAPSCVDRHADDDEQETENNQGS